MGMERWKALAGAITIALAAATLPVAAAAQEEIIVNGRTVTYEDWLFGPPNPGFYFPSKWNDEMRQDAEFRAAVDAWWERNAGIGGLDHHYLWHFITIGDGNPAEPFDLRFIAECITAGDVVIPYWSGRAPEGRQELVFIVFFPGAPVEAIIPIAEGRMYFDFVPEDEIERVIASFRATQSQEAP